MDVEFLEYFFLLKKFDFSKGKLIFCVCFVLLIDVLGSSMRFTVIFCIYEHIENKCLLAFEKIEK